MPVINALSGSAAAERTTRLRRSCLAVPGTDPRMMAKAAQTEADELVFDLEDAVAPARKAEARQMIVEAVTNNDYGGKSVAVRVNAADTPYQFDDIIHLVRGAAEHIDCLVIPKVEHPGEVWFVEHLLSQLEMELGASRRMGLEILCENGAGSVHMAETAQVSDRVETLIFGPGDYAADQGIPQVSIGMNEPNYPGHQWHYIMAQMVNTSRAVGAMAIDGAYGDYGDDEGFRESCNRARLLGIDGKWCIHPNQVDIANQMFTPSPEQYTHAERVLAACQAATEAGRGAATLDGKMIDAASRRMAERLTERGRAAGLGSQGNA